MKRLTVFETADGQLHRTEHDAKKHADAVYGNALSSLAHKAAQIGKYLGMCEFIDANLPAFHGLTALKADTILSEGNYDDED